MQETPMKGARDTGGAVAGDSLPAGERLPPASPLQDAVEYQRPPLTATLGLIGVILAVYLCEAVFRIAGSGTLFDPGIATLVALGALDKSLVVEGGQWWRLFSAPLLHGGVPHLALNGLALLFAGAALERVVGPIWFAAIFVVGALGGGLASLAINAADLISVGASGAIMGLFAAALVIAYRFPKHSRQRRLMLSGSLGVLIPSLIPLFDGLFGQRIDFAAHIGGAVAGGIVGATLLGLWHPDSEAPPHRKTALLVAVLGLCGAIFAASQVAATYSSQSLAVFIIPDARLPKGMDEIRTRSAELLAEFPRDPRSHIYRAVTLQGDNDNAGAEREWRAALADREMLRTFFKPELEHLIRVNLALLLKDSGRRAEAAEMASPVCASSGERQILLENAGLCPR